MFGPDLLIGILSSVVLFIFIFFKNGYLELFTSSIILPLIGVIILLLLAFIKHKRFLNSTIHNDLKNYGYTTQERADQGTTKSRSEAYETIRRSDETRSNEGMRSYGVVDNSFRSEFYHTLSLWGSLIVMIFVYENLRSGIDHQKKHLIDHYLMKIDVMIFGVVPSVWLQHWYHPIAVDIMSVFYALYFLIPCSVLFLLYMKGHIREFKIIATSMVITLALGYMCYIIFPASPPRFSPLLTFTNPVELRGMFIFNAAQHIWDKASTAASFCAFPSLHVGLSSIGALWGIKYRTLLPKKTWVVSLLLFTTGMLWFSTLYLRHHWFADVIAGWVIAGIASILGYSQYPRRVSLKFVRW